LLGGTSKRVALSDISNLRTLDQEEYLNENIDTDKRILVYTIQCAETDSLIFSDIDFGSYINDYELIIINAAAEKIEFKNGAILYNGSVVNTSIPRIYEGNELIGLLASKIVFNFPNATEVNLENYGLIGSLLAPNALVSGSGGSINGMLVANSLNQQNGKELHAFALAMGEDLLKLELKSDCSISIQKTDADTGQALAGAQFVLCADTAGSPVIDSGITDKNGLLSFSQLAPGHYKLIEDSPPPGYILPSEHEWLISLINNSERIDFEMEIIHIQNARAKYDVEFLKLDYDNRSRRLGNAVFSLYHYDEDEQEYKLIADSLTSDAQGLLTASELFPGRYRLLETSTPSGYYLPEDYITDFIVDISGNVDIAEDGVVKIYNQQLASISLIKHDHTDAAELLPGAEYDLYHYNTATHEYDKLSSGHTTDIHGELSIGSLQPGSYKLVETKAPDGYYLVPETEIAFTIEVGSDKRIIEPAVINATNKKLAKVQLYKVDSADADLFLAGAEFILYKYVHDIEDYVVCRSGIVSDENGSALIDALTPGDYKLVETKCPLGYILPDNPQTFFTISI